MEWTREKTLLLISEYRKRRGLWDMTHDDYRKKEIKQKLLQEVSACLGGGIAIMEIEKKFHTLRTQYHREINRMKRKEPYNSKWFGFKTLQFLSSPKACRSTKGRAKSVIKDESVTSYIIRAAMNQPENSTGSINSNNISDEFLTIQRKPPYEPSTPRSRSHELEKLIEETTKDVEEIEEPKPKIALKEITAPIEHHSYNHASAASDTSSTEQDPLQQHDIHHQHQHQAHHQQLEVDVQPLTTVDIHEGEDELNYQTNSTGTAMLPQATAVQHHTQPTRIIKIQRRDTCQDEGILYDDGMHALPANTAKRIYFDENGQQHAATILTTPQNTQQTNSNSVLLNAGTKLISQMPNRNNSSLSQTTPQTSPKLLAARDDHSTYGEYVANEMRNISNREILIALKHKINMALFEANMAEIQK